MKRRRIGSSSICRAAESGVRLTTFFGSISASPAMFIGVPTESSIANTLSRLRSLLYACIAFGIW